MARFAQAMPFHGVSEKDKWMIVPEYGFNIVHLVGGPHLKVHAHPTGTLRITELTHPSGAVRILQVAGIRYKTGDDFYINAVNAHGKEEDRISISVRTQLLITTVVHLVKHKRTGVMTDVSVSDAEKILKSANAILEPQANIVLDHISTLPLPVESDSVT